jgi:hypothetical protein
MGPFCDNPKCTHNKHMVPSSDKHVYVVHAKFGGIHSMKKAHAFDIGPLENTKQHLINRHVVGLFINGDYIEGYLCDVCHEVYKMMGLA